MHFTALRELAADQIDLRYKGGPKEDSGLFEAVLSQQKKVLKSFGLPQTLEYEKLIWFDVLPSEQDVACRIELLKEAATTYLLTKAKTDRVLLAEAQELNLSVFEVLPELGIETHTYTVFIYNHILLKKKDSTENILHELLLLKDEVLLQWAGLLAEATSQEEDAVYDPLSAWPGDPTIPITIEGEERYVCCAELSELLKQKGLRYLDRFLLSQTNLLNDEDKYD